MQASAAVTALRRKTPKYGFGEQANVFATLAQWRHAQFDDIQAVIQILAETTCGHFAGEVLVGGAEDAHIDH